MQNETLADKINKALSEGATVMATVYNGSTQYGPKWAGKFRQGSDGVYVKHGKREICYLSCGTQFKAYK